jgi:crotonobetainyl-CoA:carnitine CoA-transferase CaiB-like acyl-CoA transferase
MGRAELASDSRFASDAARGQRQVELDQIICDWTAQLSSVAVLALMREFSVPAGLIYRAPDMLRDPQFAHRAAIIQVRDALLGDIRMQSVFPRLSETPGSVRWSGPALGQHNDEIFRGLLKLPAERIELLQARNVI